MFPAAVHYREFAPCEALREHVRAFFSFAPPLEHTPGGRPLLREVRLREGDPLCPRSVADGHVYVAGWEAAGEYVARPADCGAGVIPSKRSSNRRSSHFLICSASPLKPSSMKGGAPSGWMRSQPASASCFTNGS